MPEPSEPLYLALDQGGHSSRALVFSATGALIAGAQVPVATHAPQSGWVEQNPGELVTSLRRAIIQVHASLGSDASRVRAAGLATQRSNIVCWDRRDGAALSPALSWQDRRAQHWLSHLPCDDHWLHARTGLYRSPHYGAGKLRWCLDHVPAVRRAADEQRLCCGPLAAYLLANLLPGQPCVIDPANAARTLLWNLAARDWDDELLNLFGIDRNILPDCMPTRCDYGMLAWGDDVLPLRVLTGDQSAALYAGGSPRSDTLYINLGTGAFLQRPTNALAAAPEGLLAGIVYADATRAEYVLEATVNGAGTAVDWARERLGVHDIESQLAGWLAREGAIPVFLNGVAGLGSPWWRADFASRFIGAGERWAQVVAVAESIVFLIVTNLERLQGDAPVRCIQVSGGLARLDSLCQRLADVSGLTILRSAQPEASARGVAWLLADAEDRGWRDSAGEAFAPRVNPGCAERYRRWRAEMQQALRD
ncbi:MAG TPA: FGGY family carbohydrate kinase [Gammaproteobacteria bacterium]